MKRWILTAALAVAPACATTAPAVDVAAFRRVLVEGNHGLSREVLLEAALDHLLDYTEKGVGKSAIDDAAYRIELFYRSKGYPFATVDYAIVGRSLATDGEGEASDVVFRVEEGPRIVLTELLHDSGGAIPDTRMRELIVRETGTPGETPYVSRALDNAVEAILVEATSEGYANAKCSAEVLHIDREDGTAGARIVLTPGTRHVIESIDVVGQETPPVRAELDRFLGAPFEPRGMASMLARVEETLRDAGHPDASAELVKRTIEAGRVALVVRVAVGERVTIAAVRFTGDLDTRGSYLHDLVDIEPGGLYAAAAVRAAAQRLYATGLFSRVQYKLEPERGFERDLVFELIELPSLEFWVEPGWGSYDGPRIRAGVREHNLLGTGWVLRTEGLWSPKTRRAESGVTDPVFLHPDLSLDIAVDYARREEPSFEFEETALETSLRFRISDRLSTTAGYRFKRSNLIADDLLTLDPDSVPSDFDVSAIKLSAVNDTRDNLLSPHSGARLEVSGEWADAALGSELDFLRGSASFGLFKEINPSLVLAMNTALGAVIPIHDSVEIPLQERYFLGGETSVRSFAESELGPKDAAGEPLGGEAYTLFSVELRQSLPRNFEVAAFADAGNLQANYSDVFSGSDYRYALGIGLRYELPVGSLRIDAGWNPNPSADEDDYAVHFSIGHAF